MTTAWYHMSVGKSYLIRSIREHGAKETLVNFEGTDEEALEVLRQERHNWFTIGECDNKAEDGGCQGHSTPLD